MHRTTTQLHTSFYLDIENKNTCKTCVYRYPVECGGRVIQYCWVNRSNRTFNGLAKTKIYKYCHKYRDKCKHEYQSDGRSYCYCIKCGKDYV